MLFRPEEVHGASREDDVVPPSRSGNEQVEQEFRSVDSSTAYLDRIGLVAVRARRLNPSIDTQRGADAERIPGAVGVPPASLRENSVRGRDGRERVRHPDGIPVGLEYERMCVVEQPPAGDYVMLVADLARQRRTTEFDEGRVRPIAKGDQIRVDRPNLHGRPSCQRTRGTARRRARVCGVA